MGPKSLAILLANAAEVSSGLNAVVNDRHLIVLPEGQKVESLEPYRDARYRKRGNFASNSIAAFGEYVRRNGAAEGPNRCHAYIDAEAFTAQAFFNVEAVLLRDPNESAVVTGTGYGHGDDRAKLTLRRTAAYDALLALRSKAFTQGELAEWVEDWAHGLVAFNAGGTALNLDGVIAAVRDVKVSESAVSNSVVMEMQVGRSALEEAKVEGKTELPRGFRFTFDPYVGLPERSFELRLCMVPGSSPPKFKLRILSLESQQEAIAEDFKEVLRDAVGEDALLTIGTYTP